MMGSYNVKLSPEETRGCGVETLLQNPQSQGNWS